MSENPEQEPADARSRLFSRFASLGIAAPTLPYPAHETIEEGKQCRGDMVGTFNAACRRRSERLPRFRG